MKQLLLLNPERASADEVKKFRVREAARAVVVDEENRVALLHVTKKKYYKLPGGGIEGSEDKSAALARECMEEIGCTVEVLEEIGTIVEYRKMFSTLQTSHCYLARVQGVKGLPALTDEESNAGFECVWVPFGEALRRVSESEATDVEGRSYIVPRDTALLKAAREILPQ